jgi:outer membrane biosynthesis protein TonB
LNRSSFALFVALLIHILLLLLFWILGTLAPEIKPATKPQEKRMKISLKEMPKKYKKSGDTKKQIKQNPFIAPPMPKGSQLKKISKKQPIKHIQKKIIKKSKPKPKYKPRPKPKPKKQLKTTKIPTKVTKNTHLVQKTPKKEDLNVTKVTKVQKKKPKTEDAMAWLWEDKSSEEKEVKQTKFTSGSNITSDIKELYGDEFGKLTPGQQKYILDNQEIMRRITQQVLERVARVNLSRDINVNATNVIEFYLYPNGDISDIKFLKKSGHYVLDDTTKETIEYAYSKYPRPTEKTLIRYNVFYNLASY